jgi:hypothetical protein
MEEKGNVTKGSENNTNSDPERPGLLHGVLQALQPQVHNLGLVIATLGEHGPP